MLFQLDLATATIGPFPAQGAMRIAYERDVHGGPVSAIAQVGDYLLLTEGVVFKMHRWTGTTFVPIGFLQGQLYVMSIKVCKNYFLYTDVLRGSHLVKWREVDKQLLPLAKTVDSEVPVHATELLIDPPHLGMASVDEDENLSILQYSPAAIESRGGSVLLKRADMHLGSPVTALATHRLRAVGPRERDRFATFFGDADGGVGAIVPVDERVFRRLYALQSIMANALEHAGSCNPRAHRTVVSRGLRLEPKKGVLDGLLLWRFVALSGVKQAELTQAIGSTVATVLNDLLEVDVGLAVI